MLRFYIILILLVAHFNLDSQTVVIKNINVIDTESLQVLPNRTVWIQNERISAIEEQPTGEVDPEVTLIDGQGKYLSPGLVDAHIHLFQSGGLYTRPDVIDLRSIRPYSEERNWLTANSEDLLRRYLSCGITTTIDLGGPLSNFTLRDQFQQDHHTASLYLTGPLISTYQPEAYQIEDPPIVKVLNEEEARALVRKQLPYQPDFIKIWYIVLPGTGAQANYNIVKATIEESHKNGLRVMVHATQLLTAKLAVKAGADVLVHSIDDHEVDQEFIDLLKEKEVIYCPTLIVHQKYNEVFAQTPQLSPEDFAIANPYVLGSLFDGRHFTGEEAILIEKYKAYVAQNTPSSGEKNQLMRRNLKKLWRAGVPIATGTDAGNIGTQHASSYYQETAAMAEAGMTPAAILRSCTLNGARLIGKADQFGQVKKGLLANLVVWDRNPLEDIEHLKDPSLVIHRGQVMQPDTLVQPSPAELAQQQLNAYNARDIEAFLAPYSDSVAIYTFPNQLRSKGKQAMRAGYASMFANSPLLHCQLQNRIVMGNTVIDHELVTIDEERTIQAIAIYKIRNGKIAEVYFIQ